MEKNILVMMDNNMIIYFVKMIRIIQYVVYMILNYKTMVKIL